MSFAGLDSKNDYLIKVTSDSQAQIEGFSAINMQGPLFSSDSSIITFENMTVKNLTNKIAGVNVFLFSSTQTILNRTLLQDIKFD
jgi:hypothetical protein